MAISSATKSVTAAPAAATNSGAMAMVTTLFFMWGFITCLNDILIPHLKSIFNLSYAQAMLVQFAFFSGYFIFALPAAKIVERIGYKMTMVTGLLAMALGAVLFIPAANLTSYPFFLGALIIVAAGITCLQVPANAYVSVLGPERTASSRLNLTQAFNSLGTTIAPLFGSVLILSSAPKTAAEISRMSGDALQNFRLHEAATVKFPYLLIAGTLIVLAVIIALYKLPVIASVEETGRNGEARAHTIGEVLRHRNLLLGVVAIFLYVGAEVAIGSFLVNYFVQADTGGLSEQTAAKYVQLYWGCAMVGRFIGAVVLQKLSAGKVLGGVAFGAGLLVIASMLSYGSVAMWTIILVGLFNSVMFPSIFTLGIAGLGPLTGKGSGLLIMGIVGGAIIPVVQGAIADKIGIHHAFILPVLCYLYIAFYGFKGSQTAVNPSPSH